MSLKELIKAETERLGFPICGITKIHPPRHISVYHKWIQDGRHAGMEYLSRERSVERRTNPQLIQPDARSLLVFGLRYPAPDSIPQPSTTEAHGRVAAYAWGEDYHEVIPPLLSELVQTIEKNLGRSIQCRVYTDTGPILERDFAQSAGLGWAGKNTCLIHPRLGSYFLLAEIFLSEEIEPDPPFQTDQCGTCRRCIEACPTQAIREDRTIEAVRCISYQTIENKFEISLELRPLIGDWVFGCDICQEVCPWNLRFASPDGHPALKVSPKIAHPLLLKELMLTAQDFNQKFKRSPIRRAKRRGYLRNIAVALGNLGDPASVPGLAEALHADPEPMVRGHAAWALGRLNAMSARQALENALRHESDLSVMAEIQTALER